MNAVRSMRFITPILVLFIVVLLLGCNSGSSGSGGATAEESFSASIISPSKNITITEGTSANFQATISGGTSPYTYQWDFDGGATNTDVKDPETIIFDKPGSYNVTITVTDNSGDTTTASVVINVIPPGTTDTIPPTVTTTSPGNGATGVNKTTDIIVSFSEDIDLSSVSTSTFTLTAEGIPISGSTSCSGATLTFTPSSSLEEGISYTAEVTTGIHDLSGNALDSNYSFTFTIESSSDPFMSETELLMGAWHFYYTMLTVTFNQYYSLDLIDGSTNDEGGYYIFGTGTYDDPVIACYYPENEYWTLLDPGTIINKFFVFYTDGINILSDSCYFQIDTDTDEWSRCYTLNGYKIIPVSSSIVVGGMFNNLGMTPSIENDILQDQYVKELGDYNFNNDIILEQNYELLMHKLKVTE